MDSVLKEAIYKKSSDNVTLLIIAFHINSEKDELKEFRYINSNSVDRIENQIYVTNKPRFR